MSTPIPSDICSTPPRKRQAWVPASVTNVYSAKRRRTSSTSADLSNLISAEASTPKAYSDTTADRFISARPSLHMPLNITPRTQRIARGLGLLEERILRFGDSGSPPRSSSHTAHRSNFSRLLRKPPALSITSATVNLGSKKQFLLALDGPGMPSDPFAFPLAWSHRNFIAVACGKDVYHQDLNTRAISRVCKIEKASQGRPVSIEWSVVHPEVLALGTTNGSIQLWDAETRKCARLWREPEWDAVGGMSWEPKEDLLAVGAEGGLVTFYDPRKPEIVGKLTRHKSKVHGVQWSHDGNYLATGDQDGVVYVWDARAGKIMTNDNRMGGRIRHGAAVKALAWCPWQPDLLATGSVFPDGKIRIFSIKSTVSILTPRHSITLNTATTSLHWSPHCKELLSTHGTAWHPHSSVSVAMSPLANSITVHRFPSCKRIVSVRAHMGAVGHSCLSPDGTMLFTICPAEEAMKMWKVWEVPSNEKKRESAFDKFSIR